MENFDENYYELLGVAEHASDEEIHKAWKAKTVAVRLNLGEPTGGGKASSASIRVNQARICLLDPHRRASHDRWILGQRLDGSKARAGGKSAPPPSPPPRPPWDDAEKVKDQETPPPPRQDPPPGPTPPREPPPEPPEPGLRPRRGRRRRTRQAAWLLAVVLAALILAFTLSHLSGSGSRSAGSTTQPTLNPGARAPRVATHSPGTPTGARTLFVSSTGSDATTCQSANAACATIARAEAEAKPGSTIFVGPGTFAQPQDGLTLDRDVSIRGSGLDATIIHAGASGTSVVQVDSGVTSTISDLAIEGGSLPVGQGEFGAGLANRGNLTLRGVKIANNVAPSGGAGLANYGQLMIIGCAITGNSAAPDGDGGGIAAEAGATTITATTITGNAGAAGGGVFAIYSGTIVNIDSGKVVDNTSVQYPGRSTFAYSGATINTLGGTVQ